MTPFEGFDLSHVAALALTPDTEKLCGGLADEISERVQIDGFNEGKWEDNYNRSGALFEWSKDRNLKVFAGLWLSSDGYEVKFRHDTGPQVMVFFEIPPGTRYRDLRNSICDSPEFSRAKATFQAQEEHGYQLLLSHRPLVEFVGSPDQRETLLSYFEGEIQKLKDAGLFRLLNSLT